MSTLRRLKLPFQLPQTRLTEPRHAARDDHLDKSQYLQDHPRLLHYLSMEIKIDEDPRTCPTMKGMSRLVSNSFSPY
jgi:hypothetical protein